MQFTQEQIEHIKTQIEASLQNPKIFGIKGSQEALAQESFSCIACMVGLNIVAAVPIGIAIAAGVAVAPEAAVVVAIASWFGEGVTAAAVATVLNTVIGAGGGASVEGALEALCEAFGAC